MIIKLKRKGSVLAYSLIILSMMLAIAASLSVATILAKKSASETEFSVQSLQTADSGVQLALKAINNNLDKQIDDAGFFGGTCIQPSGVATIPAQVISNAGSYELSFYGTGGTTKLNCNDLIVDIEMIKSIGVYRDTARVINVAVAAPPCGDKTTLEDVRGPESIIYPIVEIGDQCWMAENLHTDRKPDGTLLPGGSVQCDPIGGCVTPRWHLYTWAAAMNVAPINNTTSFDYSTLGLGYPASGIDGMKIQGICPLGWHLPSDYGGATEDMAKLNTYVGTLVEKGGELKAMDGSFTYWASPNTGATNATKFNAFPGGIYDGGFYDRATIAYFWTSAETGSSTAANRRLINTTTTFGRYTTSSKTGAESVRCIKD